MLRVAMIAKWPETLAVHCHESVQGIPLLKSLMAGSRAATHRSAVHVSSIGLRTLAMGGNSIGRNAGDSDAG